MNDPVRYRDLPRPVQSRAARVVVETSFGRLPLERRTALFWAIRTRVASRSLGGFRGLIALQGFPDALRARFLARAAAVAFAVTLLVGGVSRLLQATAAPPPAPAPQIAGTVSPEAAPQAWNRVDLPELGLFELAPSTPFSLRERVFDRELEISAGTLRAQVAPQSPARPLVIVTPLFRVEVVGTRFDVVCDAAQCSLEVLEGAVRVDSGGLAIAVGAGERIGSDDPRLAPVLPVPGPRADAAPSLPGAKPRLELRPHGELVGPHANRKATAARAPARLPRDGDCSSQPSFARQKGCYALQARGDGLSAEAALLTLGLLARDYDDEPDEALEYLRHHQARFPNGNLAAEVALAILETLRENGHLSEAIAAAVAYEQRFPDDPRTPEVTLARAELLCGEPGRQGEAVAVLERLEQSAPAHVRERAARAQARCRQARDDEDLAPPWIPDWIGPP